MIVPEHSEVHMKSLSIKNLVLCLFACASLTVSCTSTPSDTATSSADSEISAETNKLQEGEIETSQNSVDSALDSDEDIENEISPESSVNDQVVQEDVPQPEIVDEPTFVDEQPLEQELAQENAPEFTEPPQTVEQPVEETLEPIQEQSFGSKVTITALDYKANENGGTIVIQADGPVEYSTQELTDQNQFVVEMTNVVLPKKFQRPYNAKEFSGPVGLISAVQANGSSTAKVIVQLKRPSAVSVVQEGNTILLVPGSAIASATPTPEIQEEAVVAEEPSINESANQTPLATKTLDEFLMGDTEYFGRKISVEVADGEIREVINFISEESGVNLILSDDVKGKISVKLRQIPWDQALVLIMQTKQLGYIRQGNVLRIAPLTSIRAETDSARQLLESQKLLEPLRVKIFPISYSKAKDLEPQASGFLSTRGTAKADERTNALVVKDIAENIVRIEKLIKNLDTQTPQVFIEGRIVETRSSLIQKMGINWRSAAGSTAAIAYGLATESVQRIGAIGLEAKLDLLETEEQVKVLSAPRIVTLNNQVATIEQISQFPIYNETVDENGQITRSVDFKPIKLNLNVTPQITAEGGVILKTEILREFAGAIDQFAGDTGARSINSRSAKTTILVENGQTAVLGGIYQSDTTKSNSGIPLLRKIPIIGWLFGQDNDTMDKNELLIFLTPRILNKDKAFQVSEGVDESSNL